MKNQLFFYGGSFYPPHQDHVRLVSFLLDSFQIENLWVVPCLPYYKNFYLDQSLRKFLLDLAFAKLENFDFLKKKVYGDDFLKMYQNYQKKLSFEKVVLSQIEIKNTFIHTVDTLKFLSPDYEIFLIIGEDQANNFLNWYHYKEILNLAKIIVMTRTHEHIFYPFATKKCVFPSHNFSSSFIKKHINDEKKLQKLLPETIYFLYQNDLAFQEKLKTAFTF